MNKDDNLKDKNNMANNEESADNSEHDADNAGENDTELDNEFVETDEEGNEPSLSGPATLKRLRDKLKKALEDKQEYLNNWQKDKAEFINIRKRDEEAKTEFLKYAGQKIIEDILPTLDAFELAINHASANIASVDSTDKNFESYKKGVEGIYQNFLSFLAKNNVTPFGEAGEVFDHNLHHSIALSPTTEKEMDGKISEVLQKGYKMKDKIIRPAMVKVYEASV